LSKIGQNVKVAATKSEPAIKQGFKSIYGTLATGFDMGIKGVSKGVSKVSKMTKSRSRSRSSSSKRSKRGGTSRRY
jgi:hypothetical protein